MRIKATLAATAVAALLLTGCSSKDEPAGNDTDPTPTAPATDPGDDPSTPDPETPDPVTPPEEPATPPPGAPNGSGPVTPTGEDEEDTVSEVDETAVQAILNEYFKAVLTPGDPYSKKLESQAKFIKDGVENPFATLPAAKTTGPAGIREFVGSANIDSYVYTKEGIEITVTGSTAFEKDGKPGMVVLDATISLVRVGQDGQGATNMKIAKFTVKSLKEGRPEDFDNAEPAEEESDASSETTE